MKRKIEDMEPSLSSLPKEVLQLVADWDSDDPIKLLVLISSLNKQFYQALALLSKQKAIDSTTIQQIINDGDSIFYLMEVVKFLSVETIIMASWVWGI